MTAEMPAFDDDVWELYAPDDWTQAHDLAAEQPDKLAELQRLFLIEAAKYNVLPLDDRRVERFNPDLAGRPQLIRATAAAVRRHGAADRELDPRARRTSRTRSRRRSSCPRAARRGVIVAQGGAFGGWTLYVKEGKPAYCYNLFGIQRFKIYGERADSRRASIRCAWSSPTTAAVSARAAPSRSTSTASKVGEGRVDATVPMVFSGDETTDVGSDSGTPVTDDLGSDELDFSGRVRWVADRHRRGRRGRRPPDHSRGALPHRHGAAVAPRPFMPRYWRVIARCALISGSMRCSWLSLPTSIWRNLIVPPKAFAVPAG